eukprot:587112-Heterocapsa_arctica.AAC.1
MAEIHYTNIDNTFDQEHYCIKDIFQDIIEYMKKAKNSRWEEEGPKTEESSEDEDAEDMTGAKRNDMTKKEESDCRKWMGKNL